MDPLSITVSCVSLTAAIAKTTITVTKFVRDVRGARADLDAVSRELLSLNTVLELLAEDAADPENGAFPAALQKQVTGIITNCTAVVVEIQGVLDKHEGTKLIKAAKWAAFGSEDMNKLRSNLEAHKSALEIALEMIALTLAREIKADTSEILQDTSMIKEQMTADTEKIIAEIIRLQSQLPRDATQGNTNGFMLDRYLDYLTSYAEMVVDGITTPSDEGSREVSIVNSNRSSYETLNTRVRKYGINDHSRRKSSGSLRSDPPLSPRHGPPGLDRSTQQGFLSYEKDDMEPTQVPFDKLSSKDSIDSGNGTGGVLQSNRRLQEAFKSEEDAAHQRKSSHNPFVRSTTANFKNAAPIIHQAVTCSPVRFSTAGYHFNSNLYMYTLLFLMSPADSGEWGAPLTRALQSLVLCAQHLGIAVVLISKLNTGQDLYNIGITRPYTTNGKVFAKSNIFETLLCSKGVNAPEITHLHTVFIEPASRTGCVAYNGKTDFELEWEEALIKEISPRLLIRVEAGTEVRASDVSKAWSRVQKLEGPQGGRPLCLELKESKTSSVLKAAKGLLR